MYHRVAASSAREATQEQPSQPVSRWEETTHNTIVTRILLVVLAGTGVIWVLQRPQFQVTPPPVSDACGNLNTVSGRSWQLGNRDSLFEATML